MEVVDGLAERRNKEHRTIFVRMLIVLIILASFLVYAILSQSGQVPPGPGPSVAIDVGLLATVLVCVCIGFWVTFAANDWKRGVLLFAGLICASGIFFLLSFLGVGLLGVEVSYPAAYNNIYLAGRFMLAISIILGLTAFLALFLILHSLEVAEARGKR